jgi:hypothetical protein
VIESRSYEAALSAHSHRWFLGGGGKRAENHSVSVRAWRILLLAVCACGIAINARSLFTDDIEASSALGFQVERVTNPALVRVSFVDPGGAAQASGLRVGDLIHLRALSPGDRFRLLMGVHPHERIPIVVSRDSHTLAFTYRSGGPPVWRWDIALYCAASFWLLGFAVLFAWRRADSPEARILCLLLVFYVAGSGLAPGSWLTPSPVADLIAAILGMALIWWSAALLATYGILFARPPSAARWALTALAYAAATAISIDESVRLIQLWRGDVPWVAQTFAPDWNFVWGAIPYVLGLICAIAALLAARGAERGRVTWSVATLGLLYAMQALGYLTPSLMPSNQRGTALVLSYEIFNMSAFLAPLGMTYALFNRRLLDIGFVLNRAAIFSGVSLILVGAFILVEWLLSDWLQRASHSANLAVAAALALLLGLSIRIVQVRVEHFVDNVFFRKRRQDEEAIRMLAREAPYITAKSVLLERARTALSEHADASFASILLDDGEGTYGGINENDPALVALRARHAVLDLHALETEIPGELAYPMVARGRLIGALVLGPKRSGEAYAPDESKAIEQLAHSVAGALDVLSIEKRSDHDDLLGAIRELPKRLVEALDVREQVSP